MYFVRLIPVLRRGFGRLPPAGTVLAIVGLFEALDGFGLMQNVHDPVDFVANAAGVALALAVDVAARRVGCR